jgi:adenosylcobinamide kinase / adenosylcobinamide-phosphate guanylyltransferase
VIHLVIGGARSGKSRFAETLVQSTGLPRVYLATARIYDDDMADRVTRHKLDRGPGWFTVEEPLALAEALTARLAPERIILVECLTLWLTNLILENEDMGARIAGFLDSLRRAAGPVVIVSNEVGWGIVPDNELGRIFRDAQGRLNQDVAAVADQVTLVAAGLPLRLK